MIGRETCVSSQSRFVPVKTFMTSRGGGIELLELPPLWSTRAAGSGSCRDARRRCVFACEVFNTRECEMEIMLPLEFTRCLTPFSLGG